MNSLSAATYYTCPVPLCRKSHAYRDEQFDVTLQQLLEKYFQKQMQAYQLLKAADEELARRLPEGWEGPDYNGCRVAAEGGVRAGGERGADGMDYTVDNNGYVAGDNKRLVCLPEHMQDIRNLVDNYYSKAITLWPRLQRSYLARSQAYTAVGLFVEALADAQLAIQLNAGNLRGQETRRWLVERAAAAGDAQVGAFSGATEADYAMAELVALRCQGMMATMLMQPQPFPSPTTPKMSSTDFECMLCYNILYDPVTCPCGHTWCKTCLLSAIDQSGQQCPMCRTDLPGYGYFRYRPPNRILVSLLYAFFQTAYARRSMTVHRQLAETQKYVPIFVCTLVFPKVPTYLHIFEPRYRLMIKRCLEEGSRFGMCLPNPDRNSSSKPYLDYGTLLDIRNAEPMSEDGQPIEQGFAGNTDDIPPRYLVETVGVHRFKVLDRQIRDGIPVALIERIEDTEPEDEDAELEEEEGGMGMSVSMGAGEIPPPAEDAGNSTGNDHFECPVRAFFNRCGGGAAAAAAAAAAAVTGSSRCTTPSQQEPAHHSGASSNILKNPTSLRDSKGRTNPAIVALYTSAARHY
ncbi:hypothetical protein HK102_002128, partial [Quaeritorhiza haematococci]